MLVVIHTDCIGSCKSNYHAITTTMAPHHVLRTPIPLKAYYTNIVQYFFLGGYQLYSQAIKYPQMIKTTNFARSNFNTTVKDVQICNKYTFYF